MNDPLADLWAASSKEQPNDPLSGLWASEAPTKPAAQSVPEFEQGQPFFANSEFSRGIARGGAQMAGGLADFARVFVDSPKLKKFADEMNSVSEQIPTKAASIRDVLSNPSLAPAYIGRVTGELAPQAVAAYLTGGAGAAAGRAAGLGALGQRVAVGAGAAMTSIPQEVGNMYRETEDLTGKGDAGAAFAFGIPSGMLDALSAESIIGKVFRSGEDSVRRKVWREIVRDTVKEIPKAAGMEGVTESMQEALALLADKSADHTFELLTPQNGWRLLESAVAGAVGGGLLGGGTEIASLGQEKAARNDLATNLRSRRQMRDSLRSRYDANARQNATSADVSEQPANVPNQQLDTPIKAKPIDGSLRFESPDAQVGQEFEQDGKRYRVSGTMEVNRGGKTMRQATAIPIEPPIAQPTVEPTVTPKAEPAIDVATVPPTTPQVTPEVSAKPSVSTTGESAATALSDGPLHEGSPIRVGNIEGVLRIELKDNHADLRIETEGGSRYPIANVNQIVRLPTAQPTQYPTAQPINTVANEATTNTKGGQNGQEEIKKENVLKPADQIVDANKMVPAAGTSSEPAAGYRFSESDVRVGKPQNERKKRIAGDDITTRVRIQPPLEITDSNNWLSINPEHTRYTVEARGRFEERKPAKKAENVWRIYNDKTKEYIATGLTYEKAVSEAKRLMVENNFGKQTEQSPTLSPSEQSDEQARLDKEMGQREALATESAPRGTAEYARQQLDFWQSQLAQARQLGSDTSEPSIRVKEWQQAVDRFNRPSSGGLDEQSARETVDEWQRDNPKSPQVEVVNDPSMVRTGSDGVERGVKGIWKDGKLTVNLAFIKDADELNRVLNHERAHSILSSVEGQKALRSIVLSEANSEIQKLREKYAQRNGESDTDYETRLVEEFVSRANEQSPSVWQKIVQAVRRFLSKLGLVNLSDEEIARAILREVEKGSSEIPTGRGTFKASNALIVAPGAQAFNREAITAYHGTPHAVDKFTTSKIGTGEGAQAYGYGLYFAQSPAVAEQYQKNLTERNFIRKVKEVYSEFDSASDAEEALNEINLTAPERRLLDALKSEDWWGFDYPHQAVQAALRDDPSTFDAGPETLEAIRTFGNKYTVSLNVDEDQLLDWDKKFSEQSEYVKQKLTESGTEVKWGDTEGTGAAIYRTLQRESLPVGKTPFKAPPSKEAASNYLKQIGISGIKFLDQGSRRVGVGTRNYVIFDENDIKITHENGQEVSASELTGEPASASRESLSEDLRKDPDEVNTSVYGTDFTIKGKPSWTPEQAAMSRLIAKSVYDEAGVKVEIDTTLDHDGEQQWKLADGKRDDAAGRRLITATKLEIAKYGLSHEITALTKSLRLNFATGRMNNLFSLPIRNELFSVGQSPVSFVGSLLRAQRGIGDDIISRSHNVDVYLNKVWGNDYGGETITGILEKIRAKLRVFMTPEVISEVVKANPELAKVKDAAKIIRDGLETDFSNLNELRDTIADAFTKAGVEGKTANQLARQVIEALKPRIRLFATKAASEVESGLKPDELGVVKGKKPIWAKIVEMVGRGDFDNAIALREKARQNGWKPPTDIDIDRIKVLAARIEAMRALTKKEIDAAGGDPDKIKRERIVRDEATLPKQVELMRRLEAEWGKITRPVNLMRFFGQNRANNAAFVNELVSANLLLRLSFPFKQAVSIFSQFVTHVPTRAIAMALERHSQAKSLNQQTAFLKDVSDSLAGSTKAALAGYKDGVAQFVAALRGRGEARNVDRLMSGIAAIERIDAQAKQYADDGKHGMATLYRMLSLIRIGYRIAQAFDNLHGVPSEYVEMRNQVVMGLMRNGKSRSEAESQADNVITSIKASHVNALTEAKNFTEANGIDTSPEKLREIAHRIARNWGYETIRGLGLPADEFKEANKQLRETIGWNEREAELNKGVGGIVGALVTASGKLGEKVGLPLAIGRFGNAIAIGINRALHFTPLGFSSAAFGGENNAWFKTELDRNQRKVEAAVGSTLGALALTLALSGAFVVRLRWPKDPEERAQWELIGRRPGTIEIPLGNGKSTVISLSNSPLTPLAPYFAAGGALNDLFEQRTKAQDKLNAEAAKKGVEPQKIRPMSIADMAAVAAQSAYQTVLGGRTSAGIVASATDYGTFNATKAITSQVGPVIPTLPALQEISRMSGVVMDSKLATFTDFLFPLPTSAARKVNMLGDPAGTTSDLQRIVQTLSGGNYPVIDENNAKEQQPYSLLFATGVRPPSINPNRGYAIGNSYRPFTDSEIERYTVERGQAYKEALSALPPDADAKTVKAALNSANQRTLGNMGVYVAGARMPSSGRSSSRRSSRGLRGLRSRGIRNLRTKRKGIRSLLRR